MSNSCKNGSSPASEEHGNEPKSYRTTNEPRQDAVSPSSMPSSPATVKVEHQESISGNCGSKELFNPQTSNVPSDIPATPVTTHSISSGPMDGTKAKIGHHRVTSAVSLSGRGRVIQQPPG